MRAKITEYSHIAEIGKIGEYFNFSITLDSDDPGFWEKYSKEREKALKKHLEMKRRIIKKWISKRLKDILI